MPILRGFFAAWAIAAAGPSAGNADGDLGQQAYEAHCALCHGSSGKDDGSFAFLSELAILDLTTLSRKNAGVFPAEHVRAVIEGREKIKAHGTRGAPTWNTPFTTEGAPDQDGDQRLPEASVRNLLTQLIAYLNRLQVK